MYAKGALRVGCAPCIMSRKSEVRLLARNYPDRIDMIRTAEISISHNKGYASFFSRTKVPDRFRSREIVTKSGEKMKVATIDDVVSWSRLGGNLDFEELLDGYVCDVEYGACE